MTEAANPMPRYVVYLLHIYDGMAGSHYVGITTPPRLADRMREHAAGRGAHATAAACRCRLDFALAFTFFTEDWLDEARLANRTDLHLRCLVCQAAEPHSRHRPTKWAGSSRYQPTDFGFTFTDGATHAGTDPKLKKGKQRRPPPPLHFFGQS